MDWSVNKSILNFNTHTHSICFPVNSTACEGCVSCRITETFGLTTQHQHDPVNIYALRILSRPPLVRNENFLSFFWGLKNKRITESKIAGTMRARCGWAPGKCGLCPLGWVLLSHSDIHQIRKKPWLWNLNVFDVIFVAQHCSCGRHTRAELGSFLHAKQANH